MQTFLPWPDYRKSAEALDYKRLGKQRIEAWQIFRALTVPGHGWRNHPAVKMWRGHERALLEYGLVVCEVWIERGYRDSMKHRFTEALIQSGGVGGSRPSWFGDEVFHRAHRSNLIRKAPEHYRPLFSDVPDDLPYVWPVE